MDNDNNVLPLKDVDVAIDEDAKGHHLTEIIGKINLGVPDIPEEAVDTSASAAEDDDSVFYDNEDQDMKDRCNLFCNRRFGDIEFGAPHPQNNMGPEPTSNKDPTRVQTYPVKHQTQPANQPQGASGTTDPGPNVAPEPEIYRGGSPVLLDTLTEFQTPLKQCTSEKEDWALSHLQQTESHAPQIEASDITEEDRDSNPKGETEATGQMSSDELQIFGESHDDEQAYGERQHSDNPTHDSGMVTSGPKESFNHHRSSKYNTVSYRNIRRGNTRQKIQDFESIINL